MGCRVGGEQVDRMRVRDRIEFLEGGASQCTVGRWWVFRNLREEGVRPKSRDSLFMNSCRGRPADIDEHSTRLVGVLLDRDAYPIELPRV